MKAVAIIFCTQFHGRGDFPGGAMKTIREIRRENLIQLARGYKSDRQFALAMGLVPSHVSQLLSGTRDMGEEVARRIEEKLGLPPGAISMEPDAPSAPPLIEEALRALPADELKLLSDYRRVSPRRQEMLREVAVGFAKLEQVQQQ